MSRLQDLIASMRFESTRVNANLVLLDEWSELEVAIESLLTEGALKDAAIELAWEALRWGDSANEGAPDDKWTEIPREEAMAAFAAINGVRVSGRRREDDE